MDSAPRLVQTLTGALQKTSGCDKIARSLQYGGLFIEWLLKKYGGQPLPKRFPHIITKLFWRDEIEWGASFRRMSLSAGGSRKVFRLLGFIEQLRRAANALALIDPYRRGLVSTAKICSALFLFCDNLIWAQSVSLININAEFWRKYEYRFWLGQISLNISRDMYEWLKLIKREYDRVYGANIGEVLLVEDKSFFANSKEMLSQNKELTMDTVANVLDVLIPLNRMKYLHFPDGIIGLIGLITSILRLIPIMSPAYKLAHS